MPPRELPARYLLFMGSWTPSSRFRMHGMFIAASSKQAAPRTSAHSPTRGTWCHSSNLKSLPARSTEL